MSIYYVKNLNYNIITKLHIMWTFRLLLPRGLGGSSRGGSLKRRHLGYPPRSSGDLINQWSWLVSKGWWSLLSARQLLWLLVRKGPRWDWVASELHIHVPPMLLVWCLAQQRLVFWGTCHLTYCTPTHLGDAAMYNHLASPYEAGEAPQ